MNPKFEVGQRVTYLLEQGRSTSACLSTIIKITNKRAIIFDSTWGRIRVVKPSNLKPYDPLHYTK